MSMKEPIIQVINEIGKIADDFDELNNKIYIITLNISATQDLNKNNYGAKR